MKERSKRLLVRETLYARKYAFAWDFRIGLIIGVAVGVAASLCAGLRTSTALLSVSTAIGVAMLAVVIAAISILTVFLTEDYGILLRDRYPEDVGEVFYPYRLIAFVSCSTIIASVFGLFLWPVAGGLLRSTLLSLATAFAAWAIIGSFDLVRITAGHGRIKMRLPEIQEAYDEERRKGAKS